MDDITKPDWPKLLESAEVGNVIQNIIDKIDEPENRLRDDQSPPALVNDMEEEQELFRYHTKN